MAFFPEEGVSLDDCPVCGRTWYATPKPAPHGDDIAVDLFATAMKEKLACKRDEGRGGWENPDACTVEFLASLLRGHIQKGDPVDIGNIAMMLWNRGCRGNGSIPANPAPLPRGVDEEIKNLGVMGIRRTRNLAYRLVSHISDLQAQLAAKERECEEMRLGKNEAQQDERNARRFTLDLQKIERELTARAESAEADYNKTSAELQIVQAQLVDAEAFKQRVMEWARTWKQKCDLCAHTRSSTMCNRCMHCYGGTEDNWTPPQRWEGE